MISYCPYQRPSASNVETLDSFLYFVFEREAIRLTKESGYDGPLTKDPVLLKYKFTNIRRRDDRVSKWIINHVIVPCVENGDKYMWFTLLICRLINWPPTLARLMNAGVIPCSPATFDIEKFVQVIEDFKSAGNKVYSGAYMLYPTKMDVGGTKSRAVATHIIGDAIKHSDDIHDAVWGYDTFSVERVVEAMTKCFGISTFMAGQVVADLTYTSLEFEDTYTYAPKGPGSTRGLNRLKHKTLLAGFTQQEFNQRVMMLNKAISEKLKIDDLTAHDVQNCLCEFDKYCRTILAEGAPKQLYKPETEF